VFCPSLVLTEDAVYVAVAEAMGATLITWDDEMLARGAAKVPALTPSQWIVGQQPT
jgi:predicted nucleic acid-binding protein